MPPTNRKQFHAGLTPDRVVDAAVALTQESHLMSWSIRDLAGRLGVTVSVIYHHVGGKDLLCRRVVERLINTIDLPSTDLPWQEWFKTLLYTAGPKWAEYPGAASWLLLHGPTQPSTLPSLEAGVDVLKRAGFDDYTNFAYFVLFSNALLTVSMSEDRAQHEQDGPRDHEKMMSEFSEMPNASDSVRKMAVAFIRPFMNHDEASINLRWEYYRFVVDTTIAGLEKTVLNRS